MGAVQLDRVEAQPLRLAGSAAEGGNGIGDIAIAHGMAEGLAGLEQARRAFLRRRVGVGVVAGGADMPQLRGDQAVAGMGFGHHLAPAGQRCAEEIGDIGVVDRAGAFHPGAFGNDQADTTFGAAAVIGGDIITRNAAG